LFSVGEDFLMVRTPGEMTHAVRDVLADADAAAALAAHGRATVLARHTCAHRVDELMAIYEAIRQ